MKNRFIKRQKLKTLTNENITSPQETITINQITMQKKKRTKFIILIIWIPIVLIFYVGFWILLNAKYFTIEKDNQLSALNIAFILLGFYLTQRLSIISLRDNKKLSSIRNTNNWLVVEYTNLLGFFFLMLSCLSAYLNIYFTNIIIFLVACKFSFFMTAIVYMIIEVLAARHALTYV